MAGHRAPHATVSRLPILPTLGLASATSATAGALLALSLPALPAFWLCLTTLGMGLAALLFAPHARPLAAFALGLAWTCAQGSLALAQRLPADLEGRDLRHELRIAGLPRAGAASLRFDADVLDGPLRGRRIRLGWYEGAPALEPGSRWSLSLRLKRPRGTLNPGGFDFERHALERGLAATGYVRDSAQNRRLAPGGGVDALRARLSRAIACAIDGCPRQGTEPGLADMRARAGSAVDLFDGCRHAGSAGGAEDGCPSQSAPGIAAASRESGTSVPARGPAPFGRGHGAGLRPENRARFVQALALGDTRALDEHDWEVLRATGIAHLIAISGLHVGLVAGFGALLMRGLHRAWPGLGLRLPLPQGAALAALLAAGSYTALAGFGLPTLRTLLMIAAALLGVLLRRAAGTPQAFALSLIALLAADPLGLLGAGFWLSFVGVAWLLWCLPRERVQPAWRALLSAQGVMTVSLLPLGVWFFGQASIIGPFANLVAVPWVSFVVVPVALLGIACELVVAGAGQPCFLGAAWLMDALWTPLEHAAAWHGTIAWLPEPTLIAFVFALLGAFWLLLPRGVPGKTLALFLLLPLAWPRGSPLTRGEVDTTLIDVGQGLSVLVRTRGHALLYDAGPALEGGLDQGEAAVVPALHALGVRALDAYVESHGHNDHAGGSGAVLRAFAPARVFASDPARKAAACRGSWNWDGVRFEFLHPPADFPYLDNDSSCVLRALAPGGTLLLPGDISATVEARLLRQHDLHADVVVVPHHGSRTSSSPAFVRAVAPRIALFGTGHGNRFGLPRPEVVARWRAADAQILQSADRGAISVRLGRGGVQAPQARRDTQPRWWRED
jgi:competence protein ComEC